ncbi:MAG: hypothetical protein IPP60_10515 [Sphingobacteriales bacterium]|nr:hypothetical protein [Sphingobacteriales bacterium]MBP8192536.1 hypothetical protein [Chitinophagales bacterium]
MRNLFLLLTLTVFIQQANAQEHTPYSRYGLGYAFDNNNAQSAQMGGLSAAFQSGETVNYLNPASYAALQLTTLDAGFSGNFGKIKTQTQKAKQNSFSLNYLSLFFPIKKYWVTGVSLLPFTAKDYLLSQTSAFDTATTVKFEYEGSGTLYNLSWGNGFKYKGLHVGFNMGYLFGKLNNNTLAYQLNQTGAYDADGYTTWTFTNTKVSSFIWNAGAQYNLPIKSKKDSNKIYNITFGLAGSAPIKFGKKTYIDEALYTFQSGYLGYRNTDAGVNDFITDYIKPKVSSSSILDTLSEKFQQSTNIRIPATLNVGIIASRGIKWRAGIDFKFQPWSKYKGYEDNAASKLNNSWRIAVGGEFLPNDKNFSKFFTRLKYRAGFNYTQTNIKINNTAINEFGINFGIGIPIIITTANDEGLLQKVYTYAFNIGFEAGSRGTIQKNLVRENFYRLKFGISLNDRWFVRRKYY